MDRITETVKRAQRVAKAKTKTTDADQEPHQPLSASVFGKGVKDVDDLLQAMSLLLDDIITQRVGTAVANTLSSVVGKMMKAAELKERYGKIPTGGTKKVLQLAS